MSLQIEPIRCLVDNYCYLITRGSDAWLVDPGEVAPVERVLDDRKLTLRGVLATHHHPDHVGGVVGLLASRSDVWVAGHAHDRGRIDAQTEFVDAPRGRFIASGLKVAGLSLEAMYIPGHTLGAIAWLLRDGTDEHCFTGDTLFAAGCGRLFEGTPADMFESLSAMCRLDASAKLWFGHEYTAANLRFAASAEPENRAISERAAALCACTTPTTVALEKATNPFVRAGNVEELAKRRAAKDVFRG